MADDTLKIELELDESTLNNEIKKANSLLAKGFNNVVIDIDTKKVDTEIKSIEKKLATLNASKNILLKAEQTPETKKVLDDIEKRITALTQQKQINLSIKQANTSSLKDIEKQIKTLTDKRNEIELTADTAKASKELDEIDAQLDELDQVKQIKIQIDQKNLSSINSAVNGIGKAGAVAFGALTVATTATAVGMFKLATSASDAQEATSKLYNVFNDVATENVAESINELVRSYGFARSEAEALLGSTGNVLAGIGFVGDEALSTAVEIQKLSADLVSFTNYSGGVAGASEILTKAFLGERDALQSLGLKISEEEVKHKMLESGYAGLTGEAERLAKAQATLDIIYEKSNKALGDYNRTAMGFANQQRLTTALMDDLGVTLGNMILPYLEELIIDFNQALIKITDFVSENDELKDSFATLTTAITGFLKDGLDKILENLPQIINNIAGFVDTIGFLITNLNIIIPIIAGFVTVLIAIKVAILAINAGMIAFNLVTGGIILAIGAVVTAIALMIANWETVADVAQRVMEKVKYYVGLAGIGLETAFVVSVDAIKKAFFSIVDIIADKVIPAIMNITGALAKIPFLADEMEVVNSALEKSKSFIDNLAKASKEELDTTIQTQKDKTQAYKDEYENRIKILDEEKKANEQANKEMLEDAKNTNQELAKIESSDTGSGETTEDFEAILNTKLEQEAKYLEARKKLLEQTVKDEEEKNQLIYEAEQDSYNARQKLLEDAILEQYEAGGEIPDFEISKEASVTGDVSSATKEYLKLAESIEVAQEATQSLSEYMQESFGSSQFDGLIKGVDRAIEAFGELSKEGEENVAKFAVAVVSLSFETANAVSQIWGAINELQNVKLEAQLDELETAYDDQIEAIEKLYEKEEEANEKALEKLEEVFDKESELYEKSVSDAEEKFDIESELIEKEIDLLEERYEKEKELNEKSLDDLEEKYDTENELLQEKLDTQDEINEEHNEKIDELQAERDELEAEKNKIMNEAEYEALQQKIKDKEEQIEAEKKLLEEGEQKHAELLEKEEADEKAYDAEKQLLEQQQAERDALYEEQQNAYAEAEKQREISLEAEKARLLAEQTARELEYDKQKQLLEQQQMDREIAYELQKEELDKKYAREKAIIERKQAEATKEINIFNAILSMAQGIASAIAGAMTLGPIAGPIMAGINSALVATRAGIQIATIKAQPLPSIPAYATGGLVTRANEGNYKAFGLTPPNSQDNQLAWVGTNERVLTARQNQVYENMMYSNNGNNTENIYNTYDINIQATDGMNTRAIAKAVVREIGGKI